MRHVMTKYDADHSGAIGLNEFVHYMSVGTAFVDVRRVRCKFDARSRLSFSLVPRALGM